MAYDDIVDLSLLEKAGVSRQHKKCQYLGAAMSCMVGGNAHALCYHEHFHVQCPFKLRFHDKYPHKAIMHPADKKIL